MTFIVVNPDTPEAWEQEVGPGVCLIGSGPENHLILQHSSVALSHCSLSLDGGAMLLRDLGSTAGTYVEGERVDETELLPGAKFRAGEVELQLRAGRPAARIEAEAPAGPTATPAPANARCKHHPRAVARFHCPKCAQYFCELCVETRAGRGIRVCRKCGTQCETLAVRPAGLEPAPVFWKLLPGALAYPYKGAGIVLLVLGGMFFLLLGWMPLIGLLTTGYLFNYSKLIVATSAEGSTAPPDWPEFSDWFETFIVPYLQLFALTALAFAPAFLLVLFMPGEGWEKGAAVMAAILFGAALAPMGMLALAMFDTVTALNPVALVWSILRIPGPYLIAALAFLIAVAAGAYCQDLLALVIKVPLVPYVLSGFISLYFFAVAMRILGLLYRCEKYRLGWF